DRDAAPSHLLSDSQHAPPAVALCDEEVPPFATDATTGVDHGNGECSRWRVVRLNGRCNLSHGATAAFGCHEAENVLQVTIRQGDRGTHERATPGAAGTFPSEL